MEKRKNVTIVLLLPCRAIKKFDGCSGINFNDLIKNLSETTERASVVFKACPNFEKCSKKR